MCLPMGKAKRNTPASVFPLEGWTRLFSMRLLLGVFPGSCYMKKKKKQNEQNTFKMKLKNQTANRQEGSYFWPSKIINFPTFIKLGFIFQKTLDSKVPFVMSLFGHKTNAHL